MMRLNRNGDATDFALFLAGMFAVAMILITIGVHP